MAQITVNIHNRAYQVACEDGQELHVQKLAAYIDRRVSELASTSGVPGPAGQITESRLLVMAALLIADELGDTYDELEELRQAPPKMVADPASIKAADEARAAASAAKAQLAEAETASRAAVARAAEADAARRAADEEAGRAREAVTGLEARITQAEAALQAALTHNAELEAKLREGEAEQAAVRATIATLSAHADDAVADQGQIAVGLEQLATRVEGMAERLERAALR
ncbi:MAG TPA: cell division protein ZapA [Alphaproteobacteria bacterium]